MITFDTFSTYLSLIDGTLILSVLVVTAGIFLGISLVEFGVKQIRGQITDGFENQDKSDDEYVEREERERD